jgi:ADP-L-glycero-D-manno-heptose 6-epimerase
LAKALFAAVNLSPNIDYSDMPDQLKGKYQYFTQADMTKLKNAQYPKPFTSLEAAVKDYAGYLKDERCM